MKEKTLSELASILDCTYLGDPDSKVHCVATLQNATAGSISFLDNRRYAKYLQSTAASIVICREEHASDCKQNVLVVENPYLAYARVANLFSVRKKPEPGIHSSAVIAPGCEIAPSVSIGPQCVIEENVTIEEGVVIGPQCVIGAGSFIGADTRLFARVTLYEGCRVGARCRLHSGCVIGADGFGNANDNGVWHRVEQLGAVRIGDDVDVGANTAIDRGAIEDTVIGNGVRLDNLIQIGHNVQIGDHTAMAGCTAVAGSTKIGKHCLVGGSSGFNGHIDIADGVFISGMSGVRSSITKPGVYASGISVVEDHKWRKTVARIHKLDEITRRFIRLEKAVKQSLESKEECHE